MSTETIERTFEVAAMARLKVSNIRGMIDIQPGEEGVIHVSALKHNGSGMGSTRIVIEQQDDGTVVVETKYESLVGDWLGWNKPAKVEYVIRTPRQCSVKLNAVSSEALVQGLEGEFDLNGVSGKITLKNLSGPVDVTSVSGMVEAGGLNGAVKMNNVSGKVRVTESRIPSLVGKTVSGHVTVHTPLAEGPYTFKSVSGHVALITPADASCVVRIDSLSGHASVHLPIKSRSGGRNHQVIEVGSGGGPEIAVKSVSGHLRIAASENGASVQPVADEKPAEAASPKVAARPVETPAPPKSQMEILRAIERGEISVDEALRELNA